MPYLPVHVTIIDVTHTGAHPVKVVSLPFIKYTATCGAINPGKFANVFVTPNKVPAKLGARSRTFGLRYPE